MIRSYYTLMFAALTFLSCMPTFGLLNTRRALVIGNDTYPGNALKNARNDARAIADKLTGLGYSTTLYLDLDQVAMEHDVDNFASSLSRGDTVVVYYAGHGLQAEGENYLIPVNFHVTSESGLGQQGYSLQRLLNILATHGVGTDIVILDACRDNPFLAKRSLNRGWAEAATSAGTFLAFGTAPGSTAEDNPSQGHGLFTQSLLKFLDSDSDVDQMFRDVRLDVIRASNGAQVPWTSSSLVGSFHLRPEPEEHAASTMAAEFGKTPIDDHERARSLREGARSSLPPSWNGSSAEGVDATIVLDQAKREIRSSHFDKALSILQAIISIEPRSSLALQLISAVYRLTGRSADADQALDRAIQSDPDNSLTLSYKCLGAAEGGSPSAELTCREALRNCDGLSETHFGLALYLASAGRNVEASAELAKAIALDPRSFAAAALQQELETSAKPMETIGHRNAN